MKLWTNHICKGTAGFIIMSILLLMLNSPLYAVPVTELGSETIKQIIRDYVEENMPWKQGTARIEFSSKTSGISLPGENIAWRVIPGRSEDFIGFSVFTLKFYRNNVFLKEKRVRSKIEVLTEVVVSSRFLPRDSIIGPEDIQVVKKWCDRICPNTIRDVSDVVGKKLTSRVRENMEITRNMVRQQFIVKRGKVVRVVLEKGPLVVTTIGISEQDGVGGDLIKVRNLTSKKIIYAKVMDNSLVCVEY